MNPFKPTFGVTPPKLAGRDELLAELETALDEGPGSPGRATLYTGPRGTGKTVMLNEAEDLARGRGWMVVSETASGGLVERLLEDRLAALLRADPARGAAHLTGINAPFGVGATWERSDPDPPTAPRLRTMLTDLCDDLERAGTGLLLTVDEIHQRQIADLRAIATAVQHLFRENREIAFIAAGLPGAVSSVLNDDVLTFLRRADRHSLGPVAIDDVALALQGPITSNGRSIADADALAAAQATGGYPFMIQLVGYWIWRQDPDAPVISAAHVERGVAAARRRLGSLVHEPALADLSDVDRTFLLAMATDDGPSKMSDIARRLSVDANYASQYRLRLISAQLIEPAGHGRVDFSVPYLRDHLREFAAQHLHQHGDA